MLRLAGRSPACTRAAGTTQRISSKALDPSQLLPRLGLYFVVSFAVGYGTMAFACNTKLFDFAAEKKLQRRLEMDEAVLEFREDIARASMAK